MGLPRPVLEYFQNKEIGNHLNIRHRGGVPQSLTPGSGVIEINSLNFFLSSHYNKIKYIGTYVVHTYTLKIILTLFLFWRSRVKI